MVVSAAEKKKAEKRHKEHQGWDMTNLRREVRGKSERPEGSEETRHKVIWGKLVLG